MVLMIGPQASPSGGMALQAETLKRIAPDGRQLRRSFPMRYTFHRSAAPASDLRVAAARPFGCYLDQVMEKGPAGGCGSRARGLQPGLSV